MLPTNNKGVKATKVNRTHKSTKRAAVVDQDKPIKKLNVDEQHSLVQV